MWTVHTVASILANPRYTGRQIWNRQSTDLAARSGRVGRRRAVQRWNPSRDWVISKVIAHPALVSERDFIAVQAVRAVRPTQDGCTRRYPLAGCRRGRAADNGDAANVDRLSPLQLDCRNTELVQHPALGALAGPPQHHHCRRDGC